MKIAVFTGNQPRHTALIHGLAEIADEVFAVQECTTVFPGEVEDFFRKSDVMQAYFAEVMAAEKTVFGAPRFAPANARTLSIKMADLNKLDLSALAPALDADVAVVFGASYIKGELVERLIEIGAINIHMGVSPYYRGSSCNFWALYDGNPDLVGATIHMLSKGLDSGAMLFHALPRPEPTPLFELGMRAVKAAHTALIESLASGEALTMDRVVQDKAQEIRYTRNRDFDDAVASEYLGRRWTKADVGRMLEARPERALVSPRYR